MAAGIAAGSPIVGAPAKLPKALEEQRGLRPRLFLNASRAEVLRAAIRGSHSAMWKQLSEQADLLLRQRTPAYRADAGEQLWQRGVGNNIATLAFSYLISQDRKYLDAACRWARASCEYPTWGLDSKTGKSQEYGLVYGHQLLGLAMLFDYAGKQMDSGLSSLIRRTLAARAAQQYKAYSAMPHAYLQNHTWINSTGLLAAALVLFEEEPAAAEWIALVRHILRNTMSMLGSDGASQEGVGYWEYGLEYLLKLMHLSRQLLGDDHFGNQWFRNTAQYGLHMTIPRSSWTKKSSIVDFADCPRYHWYGPDCQLHSLAAEYRDGIAQWLAGQIAQSGTAEPSSPWLNLLWFEPGVKASPPNGLPTARHFDNMGIVPMRSGWDGNESLAVFKCGPALGFHASTKQAGLVSAGDFGHTHPDANHFVFFAHGEWLICNQGYVQRQTRFHNTLLVNGQGQYDAATWFDGYAQFRAGRLPRVRRTEFNAEWDWIVGDATDAYRPECGVKRFIRHLIFLKPDVLIIADDVELARSGNMELLFHTALPCAVQADNSYAFRGERATLRAELLTPLVSRLQTGTMPVRSRHPQSGQPDKEFPVLRLTAEAAHLETVVALSSSAASSEPQRVTMERAVQTRRFTLAGKSYSFDFGKLKL